MNLLPQPRELTYLDGKFIINRETIIVSSTSKELRFATKELKKELKKSLGFDINVQALAGSSNYIEFILDESMDEETYILTIDEKSICIKGTTKGIFYGVQTLKQIVGIYKRHLPSIEIKDYPQIPRRGFYHDVTRGKVPTLDTLKELADMLAFYKINQLQLYIEHTFAFKGQSEVWSCTDPLTADEIIELDEYCQERHIELVPSIATFGHLYEALKSYSFNHLCELDNSLDTAYSWRDRMLHHTLDVSQEESIHFVKRMIDDFLPLFTSNQFNICADETFDLGKGKNKEKAEEVGVGRLYVDFLKEIMKIVKGYNKDIMFWGDIILHHPELLEELPQDLICLNWWYSYGLDENRISKIADSGLKQYVCPGVSGWNNLMNNHKQAFDNIKQLAELGHKYNAVGLLNTDWGDYGHMNLFANSIPGLIYGGALSWNVNSYDLDDMNKAISRIHYHDEQEDLIHQVYRISQCQLNNLAPIVQWLHDDDLGFLQSLTIEEEKLYEANEELEQIMDYLLDKLGEVNEEQRIDLDEFYVSAKGVKLLNELYLIVNKYVLVKGQAPSIDPKELAVRWEYWLEDYKAVWRKRNKESELNRIIEFFKTISKELRKMELL